MTWPAPPHRLAVAPPGGCKSEVIKALVGAVEAAAVRAIVELP